MSRVFRETVLIHFSKSIIMADMFLCWEMNFLCIFNIIKDMIYDLIRGMFKIMIQSLKV